MSGHFCTLGTVLDPLSVDYVQARTYIFYFGLPLDLLL